MEGFIKIAIEKQMQTAEGVIPLSIQTHIKSGELLTLFGVSGAGKTTLLRILAGLTNPDKGTVVCNGEIWFDSERNINVAPQERNIGFMFQDYALFPNMTVQENLEFAQPQKNKKEIDNLLVIFGLYELKHQKPTQLSGGQKQRVALARALARKPQLLLLDEPLSALDFEMRNALQNQILQAHTLLGTTTVMVSHDIAEVFKLATKVVCIEHGKIVKSGTPEQVFCNNAISGKVQIVGQIAKIEQQDVMYIVTVVFANNQIMRVIAFENDIQNLEVGNNVVVFTKAFNPMIRKVGKC